MSEKTEVKGNAVSITPPSWQRVAFLLLAVARDSNDATRRDAGNKLGHMGGMLDEALAGLSAVGEAKTLEDAQAALEEANARIRRVKEKAGL